ncbi:MAG: TIGR03986 family CRISPR-associated RAMP protein [Aggregatilineales bacterium]
MSNRDEQPMQSSGPDARGVARAPYNFVPLPEKVVPAEELPDQDCYHQERHSSYFTVTLTTETLLYIRGMLTDKEAEAQEKNKPDFFERNGKPVIPGSSLRGMLRSLVEIVAFGKMARVSSKPKIFFRAVAAKSDDPLRKDYISVINSGKVQAGYLKKDGDGWYIIPARQHDGQTFVKVPDEPDVVAGVRGLVHLRDPMYKVQYIDVKIEKEPLKVRSPKQGEEPDGVLVCTGNMAESSKNNPKVTTKRKNFVVVFKSDPQLGKLRIASQAVKDYRDGLTPFLQEEPFNPEFGCLVDGRPVFYIPPTQGDEVFYFGHNPFFRIPAVIEEGGMRRAVAPRDCIPQGIRDDPKHYDMAEAIFGFIGKGDKSVGQGDKHRAYASRVSVSDAVVVEAPDGYYEDEIVPKILSGPKPTTFQHYLEQPGEAYKDKSKLRHYGSPGAKIRGHKLYWRRRCQVDKVQKDPQKVPKEAVRRGNDTQHTIIRPVKAGVRFKFTVRFENLTDEELGALAWALYLPCSPEHRHQLGMGKPYGMGVVRLEPKLYLIDRRERYTRLFEGDDWAKAEREAPHKQYIQAFERHILEQLGQGGNLCDLLRICELCVMLTPQECSDRFDYMTINSNNNMYKERPVLPYPSEVDGVRRCTAPSASQSSAPSFKAGEIVDGKVVEAAKPHESFRVRLASQYGGIEVAAEGNASPRQEGNQVYLEVTDDGNFRPISSSEAKKRRPKGN